MAGTGKSTISWTLAEWLNGQGRHGVVDLGASFFFKRGEGDRGAASRFFPTIARDLVLKIPGLDSLIADVVASDPSIFDKALGEQFDKLIHQPLRKVHITHSSCTLVLVVDALDECEKERDIKVILDLWSRLPKITTIRFRLFLTSRPELPIRLGFKKMSTEAHQDVVLHEVPRLTIQSDTSAFLNDEFLKIREEYNNDRPSGTVLGHDWPGEKVLQALCDMAVPLFIIAATVCRYVGELKRNPQKRLEAILKFHRMGTMSQMEQTYLPVLQQLTAPTSDSHEQEILYQEFQMIVRSIVLLATPLSTTSLANLLYVSQDDTWCCLSSLHSVLQVPCDPETPVRTFHLSFGEFILSDKLRDQPFGVDGLATHRMLLTKCLQLLSGSDGLRENLCDLKYPGQPRVEIDPTVTNERLSPALQYACQYWVYHIQQGKIQIHDNDEVHVFLQKHLLHWLEALSLMNRIAEVIGHIGILQSLILPNNSSSLSSFLEDARRFVLANRHIADLASFQIYSSAIVFTPQTSIVRNICGQLPTWIRQCPVTPAAWSPELQRLEGHTGSVKAVAFSRDGSLLASASDDQTVRLWDPSTGQEVQRLEGHTDWVKAVAFSHDGSLLASASDDQTVRLWDTSTGHFTLTTTANHRQYSDSPNYPGSPKLSRWSRRSTKNVGLDWSWQAVQAV